MRAAIAIVAASISLSALGKTPEEAAGKAVPVTLLGYAIGQKLAACPAGSRAVTHEYRTLCSLGPTTYAGADAVEHSITLFNGEIISTHIHLRAPGADTSSRVLGALRERFGDPDGAYSRPDADSHVWVRGSVVLHFDGSHGAVLVTDVIRNEVAKLRYAPSNQVDF